MRAKLPFFFLNPALPTLNLCFFCALLCFCQLRRQPVYEFGSSKPGVWFVLTGSLVRPNFLTAFLTKINTLDVELFGKKLVTLHPVRLTEMENFSSDVIGKVVQNVQQFT